MNIKQLETFYWIERLGSFSAAADKVFATQSTVSMRIHELEESLGVKLFDRTQQQCLIAITYKKSSVIAAMIAVRPKVKAEVAESLVQGVKVLHLVTPVGQGGSGPQYV